MEQTRSLFPKENQYENRGILCLTALYGIFGLPRWQLGEEKRRKLILNLLYRTFLQFETNVQVIKPAVVKKSRFEDQSRSN